MSRRARPIIAAAIIALTLSACGTSAPRPAPTPLRITGTIPAYLRARLRPIGRGPRFHPPARGPVTGRCAHEFGARSEAHIELFAANRVVLLAAGIGAAVPRFSAGSLTGAACFGNVVTVDPTGIVYIRRGATVTLGTLFRAWGEPLSDHRIASFSGTRVLIFVDGRRRRIKPGLLPITPRAEIVVEVGPYVPPHASFSYPPLPQVP